MRRSTDFGETWLPSPTACAAFPPGLVPNVIYDPVADLLVSMGLCHPLSANRVESARESSSYGKNCSTTVAPRAATCSWTSKDEGATWVGPVHVGNYSYGEGGGGVALSTTGSLIATIQSPNNCNTSSNSTMPSRDATLISSDHGKTWSVGGATPFLPSGQGWGECMVAELGNGSVVLTSRLSIGAHFHFLPLERAFAISHDGARTWDKAWTFPADQPFDKGEDGHTAERVDCGRALKVCIKTSVLVSLC